MQTEGISELARAKNKSNQFDHQSDQMSDISRTARNLADALETRAKEERDKAEKAKTASMKAYEQAKTASELQAEISEDLKISAAPEIAQLSKKLESLKKMTTEAHEKASSVYDESLTLFANVKSITTPEVNIPPIVTDSNKLIEDSKTVQNELKSVLEEKSDLLAELSENIELGELLLTR